MVADDIHRPTCLRHSELPEGVERIGDLAARYVQQHLTATAEQRAREGVARLTAPSTVARQLPSARRSSACPHCASERSGFDRPQVPEDRLQITCPEDAAEILVPMLQRLDREHCITLNLDGKQRLIATTTVSIGSIDHTFMSPREVYRDALLHEAAAIVIAHNHPSGDPEPSRDDELVTRRLHKAGEIVGVDVLDHMVIGHRRWVSLARRGVVVESRGQERSEIAAVGESRGRS